MAPSSRHGPQDDQRSRLTQRAPDTPASGERADTGRGDDAGIGGGNPVGSREPGSPEPGEAAGGSGVEHSRADPIGSALADAEGRTPDTPAAAGAGNDPAAGSHSLGATSGGERASAGRADANRSSRDGGNSRNR